MVYKQLTIVFAAFFLLLTLCGCRTKAVSCPSPAVSAKKKVSHAAARQRSGRHARAPLPADKESAENYKRALLLVQTMEMLRKNYVDGSKVSYEQLFHNAMRGMVWTLDPYSNYEVPTEHLRRQPSRTGKVVGIGATAVKPAGRPITLIRILPGTPAEKAKLLPGDQITAIDGKEIFKLNLGEALNLLKGRVDTQVKLNIRRGQKVFTTVVTRKAVQNDSVVPGSVKLVAGKIGYLKLTGFRSNSAAEVKKALLQLKALKAEAFILDLRYNPGGLVQTAVNIASLLLPEGSVIFRARSRNKKFEQTVKCPKGRTLDDKTPMIVLVNAFSASCSEILTGALQDHRRARVLGVRTYGKGTILNLVKVPGGGAVNYAAAHYVTPKGRVIEKKGIIPDVEVRIPSVDVFRLSSQTMRYPGMIRPPHRGALQDVQLRRAVELLQHQLKSNVSRP